MVNFKSLNPYEATVMGCPTFSFAVNLGCYLLYVPCPYGESHVKEKGGLLLPDEAQCPFRGNLRPLAIGARMSHLVNRTVSPNVWLLRRDGRNLSPTLSNVREALLNRGMRWFRRLERPEAVLRILMREPERIGRLWGFGGIPSPLRSYVTGYVALAIGNRDFALAHLKAALESGCFPEVSHELQSAIHAASLPSGPPGSP